MAHVFVSYKHDDGDFAELLKHKLLDEGFAVWMDTELRAGEDWRETIDRAVSDAFACVVIMSPAARDSEYVTYEWACAWGAGKAVIPVLIEPMDVHPRLGALQYLSFFTRDTYPWAALIAAVQQAETNGGARFSAQIAAEEAAPPIDDATRDLLNSALWGTENVSECVNAIQTLGYTGNRALTSEITRFLQQGEHAEVRAAAAQALGHLGDPAGVVRLLAALNGDPQWSVRKAAAEALGAIGDLRAVLGLIQRLSDDSGVVRGAAAQALGQLGDTRGIAPLLATVADSAVTVRAAAAEALGNIAARNYDPDNALWDRVLRHLSEHKQDESEHDLVRSAAQQAIDQIERARLPF